MLLNRASDQILIAPRQIETALGYSIHHTFSSDYRTVSAALNSGVPLTLANHSEIRSSSARLPGTWSASRRRRSTQRLPREPSSWEFFRHQGRRTRDEGPNRWHIRHRRILPTGPDRRTQLRPQYIELKASVHKKLLNRLNLEALATADRSRAESEIRTLLFELIAEEGTPLSMSEREAILGDVIDEVFGLGPLEPLLRDPSINDILVNTFKQVYVERSGKLERVAAGSRTTST